MVRIHFQGKRTGQLAVWAFWIVLAVALSACGAVAGRAPDVEVPGGDAGRGQRLLNEYGCQSCHTIPGVLEANATVGPPLDDWADRHYIAGALPNTAENLIAWIRVPQSIEPGTVMPDMDVTEQDARDMAAYLFTLRRRSTLQFSSTGRD